MVIGLKDLRPRTKLRGIAGPEPEPDSLDDANFENPIVRLGTPIPSEPSPPTRPAFSLFPRLPTELRFEIWRHCLPYRVLELDHLAPYNPKDNDWDYVYEPTIYNTRAVPVIAHVCRESRQIAFENWSVLERPDNKLDAHWKSTMFSITTDLWHDPFRTSMVHLNWSPSRIPTGAQDLCFGPGDPIRHLLWMAGKTRRGCVSIAEDFLYRYYSWARRTPPATTSLESHFRRIGRRKKLALLLRPLQELTVVMEGEFHLATDVKTAVASGLFGMLADSRVQIVHADDGARLNAFLDFADSYGVYCSFEYDDSRSDIAGLLRRGYQLNLYNAAKLVRQYRKFLFRRAEIKDAPRFRLAYMFRLASVSEDSEEIAKTRREEEAAEEDHRKWKIKQEPGSESPPGRGNRPSSAPV